MKYFNHMTCAGDDEKVQRLRDRFGLSGYGAYFLIVEKIASQIRRESGGTSLTLSLRKWSQHLDKRMLWTQELILLARDLGLWDIVVEKELITIDIPNLLKYADEYSKKIGIKSRHSPDRHLEIVPNPVSQSGEKDKRSTAARSRADGTTALTAEEYTSQIEDPKERAAAMNTIREAMKNISGATPQQQAPKSHDSENGKIPKAEGPEADDMMGQLATLNIPGLIIDDVVDAWWAFKSGKFDSYALASVLDNQGIKGQDRSRVYKRLGVL